MTTENAILQLKRYVEFAQQKGLRSADDLTQICNAIIDYYNRVDPIDQLCKQLQDLVQVFSEILRIQPQDLEDLKQTPADFIRKRLIYRKQYVGMDNMWLFHIIATDWLVLQECKKNKQHCEQMAQMLDVIANQQSNDVLSGKSNDVSIIELQNDFIRLAAEYENEIISLQ